jgi:hypothetical protein
MMGKSCTKALELQFINDEITAWGGIALLKNLMDKTGFRELLESLPLPAQGSNRGYSPIQLIMQFIATLWCGANRYSHLDISRFDATIQKLFGWGHMPEHKAFQRYFQKFSSFQTHSQVFGEIYKWFWSNLNFDNFTLDIDSSVITRYGNQEASSKGYNPKKPGRKSQHPLIAFVADVEMVANFWLRSGNSHSANNFQAFLEETLHHFPGKKIGLLRLDSGFYSREILDYLENREQKTEYIIAAPMYYSVQRSIASIRNWMRIDHGIEISEFTFQAPEWEAARRKIVVRQKIEQRPNAVGKQLSLFDNVLDYNGYRYTCYVTNLTLGAAEVWRLYRGRANCENKIKELKYDYGLDKLNQTSFDGTETSLVIMTIAYNFMSLFRQVVMPEKIRHRLSTLRYKLLAIPSMIEENAKGTIIKMAVQMKRRVWIQSLWDRSLAPVFMCNSA